MALPKLPISVSERRAEALRSAMARGRANLQEAALILGKSWPTVQAHVQLGKIQATYVGKRFYVSLAELQRQGVTLPRLSVAPECLSDIDSNTDNGAIHE